jgi:uncharacterized Fe-S cluster-containing radical SAM superfamily protein
MVYVDLRKDYDSKEKPSKVISRQKCGNYPYELCIRFAGCSLSCGLCFASGYSWSDRFLRRKTVTDRKTVEDAVTEFEKIPPPRNSASYNWLRVLGGEPFLNDEYVEFVLRLLVRICSIDSGKFSNRIVIQTNGIHVGKENTSLIKDYLEELYRVNPSVVVAIETSIKGTNPEEFKLLTRSTSDEFYRSNLSCYYELSKLRLPNLRSMIVAGFGVNESFLLGGGKSKFRIAVISRGNLPCYHPKLWTKEFDTLYSDFTNQYRSLDPMFSKMPMYGIADRFRLGWVRRAKDQGKDIYGDLLYDSADVPQRNMELENSFQGILQKFFLVDNQTYYSAMTKHHP